MEYKDFIDKFLITQTEIITKLSAIEAKIDDYKEVKDKAETSLNKSNQNEKDIAEINDKIKWLSRTITASLITGTIGIFYILIKMGLGIK